MVKDWILGNLWDGGFFCPERLGDGHVLYRVAWDKPLVVTLIDGVNQKADWGEKDCCAPSEALFATLADLAAAHPASWVFIQNPDGALSTYEGDGAAVPESITVRSLWAFDTNPLDEGGDRDLLLVFHDRRGLIDFRLTVEDFSITFYGDADRYQEIAETLGVVADSSETPPP